MIATTSPTFQDNLYYERITRLNQIFSPLLRLPAEIRNHIYTLVYTDQAIRINPLSLPKGSFSGSPYHHKYSGSLSLLITSRQLNAEAASLFLSTCIFDISNCDRFSEVLASLGRARLEAIESIMLHRHAVVDIIRGRWTNVTSSTVPTEHVCFSALRRLHVTFSYAPSQDTTIEMEKRLRNIFTNTDMEVVYEYTEDRADLNIRELLQKRWHDRDLRYFLGL